MNDKIIKDFINKKINELIQQELNGIENRINQSIQENVINVLFNCIEKKFSSFKHQFWGELKKEQNKIEKALHEIHYDSRSLSYLQMNELEKRILNELNTRYPGFMKADNLLAIVQENQIGLQNVYNKFLELENRQKEIEDLLKSDRLSEIINKIPSEKSVQEMLARAEKIDLNKLMMPIQEIRENLEDMLERFTW